MRNQINCGIVAIGTLNVETFRLLKVEGDLLIEYSDIKNSGMSGVLFLEIKGSNGTHLNFARKLRSHIRIGIEENYPPCTHSD